MPWLLLGGTFTVNYTKTTNQLVQSSEEKMQALVKYVVPTGSFRQAFKISKGFLFEFKLPDSSKVNV